MSVLKFGFAHLLCIQRKCNELYEINARLDVEFAINYSRFFNA